MVDLSFLKKFTKGDEKKMKRYIGIFLNIAPETFVKMEQNIVDQNWEQLRINAHSLKPQADYMGIAALKDVLINIENAVKEGRSTELIQLYQQAFQLHEEASLFLSEHIKGL